MTGQASCRETASSDLTRECPRQVLIHISRIGTKDAEEDAWAALLGDED